MPVATAVIAAITDPPGPKVSMPPLIQVGRMPSAPSRTVQPPSPMPTASIAGYVESPSMSASVRPASAMAASHASIVSDSGLTMSRRPIFDTPMPVIAERSSNLSVPIIGRTCLAKSRGSISSGGSSAVWSSAVGLNSGSQVSSFCSKTTSTTRPSSRSSGSHPMMLVVRRTRGSSSMATCAMTYGASRPGMENRWLTVNALRTARPDTARTPMLWLWQ